MKKTITTRGAVRTLAPYVHWTQKRGAKTKLAKAAKARWKTRRHRGT